MYLPSLTLFTGIHPLLRLAAPHAGAAQTRSSAIKGKYLVALKLESSPAHLRHHTSWVQALHARHLRKRQATGDTVLGVERMFSFEGFRTHSGSFDEETIEDIKRGKGGANNGTQHTYISDPIATGRGQFAYVIDTGIQANHTEFVGRLIKGFNEWENYTAFEDTFGHGTHVAGTIAGKTVGIARDATLVDVKAFWGASGELSSSIASIEWAVNDILKNGRANYSVINMSFGYREPSDIMFELINAAYNQGVLGVAAAGNDNVSMDRTPGTVPNSLTVAASDRADNRAFYSNWGPGVDVFAPGSDIYSAWVGGNTSTYFLLSGTSMATPLVAGLVAYLRGVSAEASKVSAAATTQRIKDLALKGVIEDPRESPNMLVKNNSGA